MIQKVNRLEFENLGEDRVRSFVAISAWSDDKSREAREWLSLESNKIARSAKNAAWIAAIAAIVAAIAAVVTIYLSLYAPHPTSLG